MSLTADPESTPKQRLRIALDNIDYTLATPGPLDNSNLPKVPVIRVYGNSSTGIKACIHIHQVFPYFFVDYLGSLHPRDVKHYVLRLIKSLNHAIALSLKRNPQSSKSQYIRSAILVKGIPFYGFHSAYAPFLKVCVADPALVNRIVTILRSGIVMKTRFRIYESHLSLPLQFMCDFGLYGCGFLDVEGGWERCMDDTIDTHSSLLKRSPHFRQSRLPLELDVIAPQILNRHSLTARNMCFNIGDPPSELPNDRLVLSVKELWEDESNRRRIRGLNPSPEVPSEPSDASRGTGGNWVAEVRYWEALRKRMASERTVDLSRQSGLWEYRVMSTFESIEALWDEEWKTWKPSRPPLDHELAYQEPEHPVNVATEGHDLVEVDIGLLSEEDLDASVQVLEMEEMAEQHEGQATEEHSEDEDEDPDLDVDVDVDVEPPLAENDVITMDETIEENPFGPDTSDLTHATQSDIEYRLKSPPALAPAESHGDDGSPTPDRLATTSDLPSNIDESYPEDTRLVPASLSDRVRIERDIVTSDQEGLQTSRKRKIAVDGTESTFPSSLTPRLTLENGTQAVDSLVAIRTVHLSRAFQTCNATNSNRYQYSILPPTRLELQQSCEHYGVPQRLYRPPHYSDPEDVPVKSREYGGLVFRLKGNTLDSLDEWVSTNQEDNTFQFSKFDPGGVAGWEYASHPPTAREVKKWLVQEAKSPQRRQQKKWQSQIEGPTQANIYGFKNTPVGARHGIRASSNFTLLCLEVLAPTEGEGSADSETDEIVAAFYALQTAGESSIRAGIIATKSPSLDPLRLREFSIEYADNELDLVNSIIDTVVDLDPDIITGWEIQRGSWGYLEARGKQLGLDVSELISRAPSRSSRSNEQWGFRKTSTFQTVGRHVFNAWRIMRSEHTLTIYTFENVAFHVLQRRFPKYTLQTLTEWYHSLIPSHTSRLLHYKMQRTCMVLEMLEETEVVTKSAEFARVFGVDFFSVISRGSQFKVESFMFRIAKPESFVLISPSKDDVGKQNAAECMPLIMEPTSAFYTSPLVVLDFQSLYPSVMIAYNYCYSTCLGRVQDFQGTWKLGVDNLDLPEGVLGALQDNITVAPNGIMYVNSRVRRGLLGRMLTELLDTRVMVKQAMKGVKNDKALKRVLDARQLALKYIANVTYGYTGATFSGRMPAVEIADSIVQTGRETLEKAISLVNSTKKWDAQVVYGDTDSMFIYLRGRTKEDAFRIGYEIADVVTSMNPAPIKLKFEKVYLPSVLMAKKRYVGFKYESVDATEPGFDAKGIETVRRDGVLAQRKMTENTLKILFRTQDLSQIKEYCHRSWSKLLENKAIAHDFIFAKEVRMGTYSDTGVPPPGVMVAARKMLQDPNYEPQYAERVPYVVVKGNPGSRLVDRAMDPIDFFNDRTLQLDAEYYIQRVLIPPLDRILSLVGADVKQWYQDMPKLAAAENASPKKNYRTSLSPETSNMDGLFGNLQCLVCTEPAFGDLCERCYSSSEETVANLGAITRNAEKRLADAQLICASCAGSASTEFIECESTDCPWFYARQRADEDLALVPLYEELARQLELDVEEKLSQC